MTETEEYFPRGGHKPTNISFKASTNFLGLQQRAPKKRKRDSNKQNPLDEGYINNEANIINDRIKRICNNSISYEVLREGTVLMGRVQHIYETKLIIALPGRMRGTVVTSYVSLPYNNLLQNYVNGDDTQLTTLYDLFVEGEYVLVKVLECSNIGGKPSLILSMLPQHVNENLTLEQIKTGSVLKGAVESVEDHGYMIDLGVPDCRVFLPNNLKDNSYDPHIGQNIWCTVTKRSIESKFVTVSNSLEKIQNSVVTDENVNNLLPGAAVDFVIDEASISGLQGHFFKEETGYIQRAYVEKVKNQKIFLGQKVRARLLYIMPTSNIPFFTMKNIFATAVPDLNTERKFKDGEMVNAAKIIAVTNRSVYLRLPKNCVGQIYVRNIKVDEDLSDEDVVAKMYPLGCEIRVRICHYRLCDYLYMCTDEYRDLNQQYFVLSDFRPGELVEGVVKAIKEVGVQVEVGKLLGLVPKHHISDIGMFENGKQQSAGLLMKKYRIGQKVRARVLAIQENMHRIFLTMKPSFLVENFEPLTSIEEAVVGKSYTGFVHVVLSKVVKVRFFNNVQALVFPKYMSHQYVADPKSVFFVGQIVNCTILKVDINNQTLEGSFRGPPSDHQIQREPLESTNELKDDSSQMEENCEAVRTTEEETNSALPTVKDVKQPREADSSSSTNNKNKKRKTSVSTTDQKDAKIKKSNPEKLNEIEPIVNQMDKKKIKKKNKKINSNKFSLEGQLRTSEKGLTNEQEKIRNISEGGEGEKAGSKIVKHKKAKKSKGSPQIEETCKVVESLERIPKSVLPSVKAKSKANEWENIRNISEGDEGEKSGNKTRIVKSKKTKKLKSSSQIKENGKGVKNLERKPKSLLPSVKAIKSKAVKEARKAN